MSSETAVTAACPRCGAAERVAVLESLTGDVLPWQLQAIAEGRFEQTPCARCGERYQPEHCMLLTRVSTGLWLVMHPAEDRQHFAILEREVAALMAGHFALAPPSIAARLRGVRPRLVFGQAMLAEAVRGEQASIDPALLECAKLALLDVAGPTLGRHGPIELCFEELLPGGALRCGVRALAAGPRLDEVELPAGALATVRAELPRHWALYPELFRQPYVSATRYLYPGQRLNA